MRLPTLGELRRSSYLVVGSLPHGVAYRRRHDRGDFDGGARKGSRKLGTASCLRSARQPPARVATGAVPLRPDLSITQQLTSPL